MARKSRKRCSVESGDFQTLDRFLHAYILNDPSEKKFQRPRHTSDNAECKSCISLEKVMETITAQIDSVNADQEMEERMKHECKQYIESINAWKAHLLRTVNQEEAKQDALAAQDEHSCLR